MDISARTERRALQWMITYGGEHEAFMFALKKIAVLEKDIMLLRGLCEELLLEFETLRGNRGPTAEASRPFIPSKKLL